VLLAAVAMLTFPLGIAYAQVTAEPIQGHFGDQFGGLNLVAGKDQGKSATNVLTTIYDNTSASALVGISSTDLASQWGDELFTTGTGLLSTHKFTLFNTGSSAGNLLTATVSVSFFNAVTSAPLGSYSTNINFGAGLPPGFFSIITVTALDPLLILLNTTDIIAIQRVTAKTGAANRLGVVSMGPVLVGSSPLDMFISSATIGGGVPGFYLLGAGGNPPADPGHFLAVNPPPVGTASKTWGALKKLYH
jgi:hypothetical protein